MTCHQPVPIGGRSGGAPQRGRDQVPNAAVGGPTTLKTCHTLHSARTGLQSASGQRSNLTPKAFNRAGFRCRQADLPHLMEPDSQGLVARRLGAYGRFPCSYAWPGTAPAPYSHRGWARGGGGTGNQSFAPINSWLYTATSTRPALLLADQTEVRQPPSLG